MAEIKTRRGGTTPRDEWQAANARSASRTGNSHTEFTADEMDALVEAVWQQGRAVPGADPAMWRQDECGAWIHRGHVGHARSDFGWKIESVAAEGPAMAGLLRPYHWRNAYDRIHRRAVYSVNADAQQAAARLAGLPCRSGASAPPNAVRQVGAPDPALETSPIFDDREALTVDQALEDVACYFNGAAYRAGDFVMSGEELLRCDGKGVWVRAGRGMPR